jgi:hypothetical protein
MTLPSRGTGQTPVIVYVALQVSGRVPAFLWLFVLVALEIQELRFTWQFAARKPDTACTAGPTSAAWAGGCAWIYALT